MASSIDDEFDRWAHLARATTETLISLLRSGGSAERTAAARQLQIRGGEAVLDEAVRLCREHEPSLREVGAFVLGQLGTPARPYASETLPALVGLLTNDPDPGVRSSAAFALGHLELDQAVPFLRRAAHDPQAEVRTGVAFSLAELRDAATLCRLAQDQDSGVRNWAAFGLRRLRVDDRETRQLLLELASDDDSETREEAVCALAELGDTRVVGRIVEELSNPDVSLEVIEASSNLGDVRVLEALRRLKEASGSAGTPELEHAISKIERAIAETDFE